MMVEKENVDLELVILYCQILEKAIKKQMQGGDDFIKGGVTITQKVATFCTELKNNNDVHKLFEEVKI